MKNKIIQSGFLAFLLLVMSFTAAAQDEAAYQKTLAEAYAQSNPSKYRAKALVNYHKSIKAGGKTDDQVLQLTMERIKELAEIDFYAVFEVFLNRDLTQDYINKMFPLLPPDQKAAIRKMSQLVVDNFHLQQSGKTVTTLPEHLYKPGYGWGKTVSSNLPPKDKPSNTTQSTPAIAGASPPQTYTDYFKLGNQQLDNKDYDAAIKSFSECLRMGPKATGCYFNRGLAYDAKKNYDASIADYTQFIKLVPNEADSYLRRGLAHALKKNTDAALADLEAALKIAPNDEKVKAGAAAVRKVAAAAKELQAAKNDAAESKKNLENSPGQEQRAKDAVALAELGSRMMAVQQYDAAITAFTKCFETNPLTLDCLRSRAAAYSLKKEYDLSIADYTFLIRLEPDAKLYYSRAFQHSQKKDFDAALKDLTSAIELSPEDAELYKQRGGTHFYKRDYPKAAADFTQAIKIKPQEANYYFMRGYVHEQSGAKDSAIADYKKTLQLNPNMASAKQQLQGLGVQP